jgi:predicted phage terminase large subunit-like protein
MDTLQLVNSRIKGKEALLTTREGRLALTKYDPLLFAYIYLRPHITADDNTMTMNEFHLELSDYSMILTKPAGRMAEYRHCFIAPRATGKSTWVFLIMTLWAAAHGHQRFIMAFSDSASQAEQHLKTFMQELEGNELLRADFPTLCQPKMGGYRERAIAANRFQYIAESGFIFMAKGADNAVLGMKVGAVRPTWIILDDIEKGETNYSEANVASRLLTLQDDIFPLNSFAKVTVVGTTTRPGAILDQIRRVAVMRSEYNGTDEEFREDLPNELRWVVDENFTCKHMKALMTDAQGNERSLWPEKWTLEDLKKICHTRTFAKNYQCEPISDDANYWTDDDINIDYEDDYGNTIISIDPAVTTNKRSDFTAIAVISRGTKNKNRLYVRHVRAVKVASDELKAIVQELIKQYGAKVVYVETNQGGDLWKQVFEGVAAKVSYIKQSEKKEIRAQRALDFYQRNVPEVVHTEHFPAAEEQLLNFPKGLHDDMVDAISSGVLYFKRGQLVGPATITKRKYVS